jgi:hypothetical protein
MRMHRPCDLRLPTRSLDHLTDGEPGEGLTPLTGEDVRSLGLLLTLQSFEPGSLITFQIMGPVNAALEPPDLDRAFAPVDIVPAQIDEF